MGATCEFNPILQKSQSSEEEILLRSVDLDTTGMYRCEISGEAPLFQTASREAVLAVVGKFFALGFPKAFYEDKSWRENCFFLTSNTFEAGSFHLAASVVAFFGKKNIN